MLIGVISDTHGDHGAIERAVTAAGTVDMWLHGGDYSQDSHYIAKVTSLPVIAVRGNCDSYTDAKVDEYIDAGAVRIWLTHGNRFSPHERIADLAWWSAQYGVQIVIYGHTHVAYNKWHNNVLIFNPGSPSRPRCGGAGSFGLLSLGTDGSINAKVIELPHRK